MRWGEGEWGGLLHDEGMTARAAPFVPPCCSMLPLPFGPRLLPWREARVGPLTCPSPSPAPVLPPLLGLGQGGPLADAPPPNSPVLFSSPLEGRAASPPCPSFPPATLCPSSPSTTNQHYPPLSLLAVHRPALPLSSPASVPPPRPPPEPPPSICPRRSCSGAVPHFPGLFSVSQYPSITTHRLCTWSNLFYVFV